MKYVASYSGGKDSTAMLILAKKHNLPLDEILYADVGDWMWPGIDEHLQEVEEYMDMKITKVNISEQITEGFKRWGFPSPLIRWCTNEKINAIKKHIYTSDDEAVGMYMGIAADEAHRAINSRYRKSVKLSYPLIDYDLTEADALELCYKEGFTFGGVYEHHSRFNCWCCPLQKLDELRVLFKYYPELWEKLREMQWTSNYDFRQGETIFSLEHRWWNEQNGSNNERTKWEKL